MGALQHTAPSETVTAKRREQEIETQESGGEEACHLGGGARERHDVGRNHGDRGLLEPLREELPRAIFVGSERHPYIVC